MEKDNKKPQRAVRKKDLDVIESSNKIAAPSKSQLVMVGTLVVVAIILAVTVISIAAARKVDSEKPAEIATEPNTTDNVIYVPGTDYRDSTITTYAYDSTLPEGNQLTYIQSLLIKTISNVYSNNPYMNVQVSEDGYDTYMYNSSRECVAMASDGTTILIYRNDELGSAGATQENEDGTVTTYSFDTGLPVVGYNGVTAEVGYDYTKVSILEMIENGAYNLGFKASDDSEEGIRLFNMVLSDSDEAVEDIEEASEEVSGNDGFLGEEETNEPDMTSTNTLELRMDITGRDAFAKIYGSEDEADYIIENLASQLKSNGNISEDGYYPHMIITVWIDKPEDFDENMAALESQTISIEEVLETVEKLDLDNLSSACYLVVNNSEDVNWIQDGYINFDSWSLSDEWYGSTFSGLSISQEDGETVASTEVDQQEALIMISQLVDDINTMISDYAEEHGLDVNSTGYDTEDVEEATAIEDTSEFANTPDEDDEAVTNEELSEETE